MKRRTFLKMAPMAAMAPAALQTLWGKAAFAKTTGGRSAGRSGTVEVPDFAEHFLTTDMNGLGPDGKPTGQTATFTGASKAGATADSASAKMKLTAEAGS